jgi:hypothetical protein
VLRHDRPFRLHPRVQISPWGRRPEHHKQARPRRPSHSSGRRDVQPLRRGHGHRAEKYYEGQKAHPHRRRAGKAGGATHAHALFRAGRSHRARGHRGQSRLLGHARHRGDGPRRGAGFPGHVEGRQKVRREDNLRLRVLFCGRYGRQPRRPRQMPPAAGHRIRGLRYRDHGPQRGGRPHDRDRRRDIQGRRDKGRIQYLYGSGDAHPGRYNQAHRHKGFRRGGSALGKGGHGEIPGLRRGQAHNRPQRGFRHRLHGRGLPPLRAQIRAGISGHSGAVPGAAAGA